MKKFLSLLALILLISFSVANAAKIEPVTDEVGLLKAQEIQTLNDKIHAVEQAHKIKIGVAFVKKVRGDIVEAADGFLQKNFINGANGGIVFYVDMNAHRFEVVTDRRLVKIITIYDGLDFLKEKFHDSLGTGDYYGATNDFIDGVDELMTYYETKGVPYGQRVPGEFDPIAAAIAVAISIFCGVSIRSMLIGKMSNIRHAMEAIKYLKKNSFKLIQNRDTFLFMHVERHTKSGSGGGSNSSSGSTSSGGGHSGGSF